MENFVDRISVLQMWAIQRILGYAWDPKDIQSSEIEVCAAPVFAEFCLQNWIHGRAIDALESFLKEGLHVLDDGVLLRWLQRSC